MPRLSFGLLPILAAFWLANPVSGADAPPAWGEAVEQRLTEAGTNRSELVQALATLPAARRDGLLFLIEHMPAADLKALRSDFLVENVNLAYDAWENAPWHDRVDRDLFFNDILPYACLSEPRDPWRKRLMEVCAPIVANSRTPGEGAQLINQKMFPLLKVRYDTARRRPDQSPEETIRTGIATCTGLSILLVDACRSVGIPARLAGTPMWSNMRGNHTWIEVWDGEWKFTGAAEPDPAGLNRGWFMHDAAQAQRDVPHHAIYATSFRRTGLHFPLVWAPADTSVPAVNVTDRYAASAAKTPVETVRLAVKVVRPDGKRIVAELRVVDSFDAAVQFTDQSRGETADLNDFAVFQLTPGRTYKISARAGALATEQSVAVTQEKEQVITLTLKDAPSAKVSGPGTAATTAALSSRDAERLERAVTDFFNASPEHQAAWRFQRRLEKLLVEKEPAVRRAVWDTYRRLPHLELRAEFDAKLVKSGGYQSSYTVKTVGERPKNGWALFIAMHGGGGAPKAVNDSQWKHMQEYYREKPEAGGYLYLALRAPNDEWNGFYADYVYPLVDRLLRQFRMFGDIDPDKIFLMGYSHGGYGAYAIGPKMPDRFAAIHASAAAPTDGETTARTLRTTRFTAMVGERDTMYGRYERNLKFKAEIELLRERRPDAYPVTVTIVPNHGHSGLPDRDLISELYPAVRDPVPREIDWLMTDPVIQDFFWLRVDQPSKGKEVLASCHDNRFVFTGNAGVTNAIVYADSRLVDLNQPVAIELNGSTTLHRLAPSLKVLCATIARRADPGLAFTAQLDLAIDPLTGWLVVVH